MVTRRAGLVRKGVCGSGCADLLLETIIVERKECEPWLQYAGSLYHQDDFGAVVDFMMSLGFSLLHGKDMLPYMVSVRAEWGAIHTGKCLAPGRNLIGSPFILRFRIISKTSSMCKNYN